MSIGPSRPLVLEKPDAIDLQQAALAEHRKARHGTLEGVSPAHICLQLAQQRQPRRSVTFS